MSVTNLLKNCERKKVFFRKKLSKFKASDNSNLQIIRSLQNKTTDHNNYTFIEMVGYASMPKYIVKLSNCCLLVMPALSLPGIELGHFHIKTILLMQIYLFVTPMII